MANGKVLWGKLFWWLSLNVVLLVVFGLNAEPGLIWLPIVVSAVVWLIIWRRGLALAAKTDSPPSKASDQ